MPVIVSTLCGHLTSPSNSPVLSILLFNLKAAVLFLGNHVTSGSEAPPPSGRVRCCMNSTSEQQEVKLRLVSAAATTLTAAPPSRRSAVMAAFPSAPFVVLCACSWLFVLCEEKQVKVKSVQPGDDVTLQCQRPKGADIAVIVWSRTDLKSDKYVFFYRSGRSNENDQLLSFRGRVELTDPEVRDASVVLKNVTFSDTGTYECRVKERNTRRRKRDAPEPTSIIKLTVGEGGHEDGGHKEGGHEEGGHKEVEHTGGSVGLIVSLSVIAVLVVGVVGFVTFRKRRRSEPTSYQPPADDEKIQIDICRES